MGMYLSWESAAFSKNFVHCIYCSLFYFTMYSPLSLTC